jgi:twitching motility protein PilT
MHPTSDDLVALLREMVQAGATELHLKVPARPLLRREGRLLPTQQAALTPAATLRLAQALFGLASVEVPLATLTHREVGFGIQGLGRFHATLYRQRGSLAMRVARLPFDAPRLQDLGLESSVEEVLAESGLVLVCGGRRRAGLLASLVDRYNASYRGFVVTIEDPISYLHRDGTATIAQRGVGSDVPSIAEGICGAMRQQADLIAVGDVPDRATAEAILRAAEEGSLVLAAVAAPDVNLAASWILRHYTSDTDMDAKGRVKRLLRGVLCVPDEGAGKYVSRRSTAFKQAS